MLFILGYLNPQQALFCELQSHSCITAIIIICKGIELIKQTWFLLARRDSQIEGFLAN